MKTFRVVGVSSNRNAFGLNQLIFLSTGEDREAFSACIGLLSPPDNARKFDVGTTHEFNTDAFPFNLPHMELHERLPPPTPDTHRKLHKYATEGLTKPGSPSTLPANPKE